MNFPLSSIFSQHTQVVSNSFHSKLIIFYYNTSKHKATYKWKPWLKHECICVELLDSPTRSISLYILKTWKVESDNNGTNFPQSASWCFTTRLQPMLTILITLIELFFIFCSKHIVQVQVWAEKGLDSTFWQFGDVRSHSPSWSRSRLPWHSLASHFCTEDSRRVPTHQYRAAGWDLRTKQKISQMATDYAKCGINNWIKIVWPTCSSLEGVLVATGSNTKPSSVFAVAQPAPTWTLHCNCSSRHLLLHLLEWAKVTLNGLHQVPYRKWHVQFILEAFIKCWRGLS